MKSATIRWLCAATRANSSALTRDSSAPTVVSFRPVIKLSAGNTDPLAGGGYAWAHIAGQTLHVNILTIAEDGGYAMQVYDRTVRPQGMALVFRRVVNGATVHTVDGKLIKFAE